MRGMRTTNERTGDLRSNHRRKTRMAKCGKKTKKAVKKKAVKKKK